MEKKYPHKLTVKFTSKHDFISNRNISKTNGNAPIQKTEHYESTVYDELASTFTSLVFLDEGSAWKICTIY